MQVLRLNEAMLGSLKQPLFCIASLACLPKCSKSVWTVMVETPASVANRAKYLDFTVDLAGLLLAATGGDPDAAAVAPAMSGNRVRSRGVRSSL
jgi:hypothetical protein